MGRKGCTRAVTIVKLLRTGRGERWLGQPGRSGSGIHTGRTGCGRYVLLASVRPTTSASGTLRCPQRSGHLLLLLRHWLCCIHRRMPSRPLGTPEHRSESWALPSLCRATPSATSERLLNSGVVRLIANPSVLCRFLRFLSTEAPFLHRSYPASSVVRASPPSHTARPVSRELPVDPYGDHRLDFPCCAWSPLPACRRQYPGRSDGTCLLVPSHQLRPSLDLSGVGSCISRFGACTAFTLLRPAGSPSRHSEPLHQRLQQLRCLGCCSDCYRLERASSRAWLTPAVDHHLSTAHLE